MKSAIAPIFLLNFRCSYLVNKFSLYGLYVANILYVFSSGNFSYKLINLNQVFLYLRIYSFNAFS